MVKFAAASPYIYGIDALRFVCALMVTVFHLGFASWASPLYLRPYPMPLIENIAQPGWVGVELFFVISGFVIVNSAASATAMSFLKGRILRLYPAVWICASLTLIVIATDDVNRRVIKNYLRSITLYPGGPWIDGQYWTLACEICFYAIVFVMCLTGQKTKMPALAFGLSLASTIFIALLYAFPDAAIPTIFTETAWRAIPFYYGCQFALGIYIWLLVSRPDEPDFLAGFPRRPGDGGCADLHGRRERQRPHACDSGSFLLIIPRNRNLAGGADIGRCKCWLRQADQPPAGLLPSIDQDPRCDDLPALSPALRNRRPDCRLADRSGNGAAAGAHSRRRDHLRNVVRRVQMGRTADPQSFAGALRQAGATHRFSGERVSGLSGESRIEESDRQEAQRRSDLPPAAAGPGRRCELICNA
ncbi:acyltransferase family protein [Rhizobium esperanzae]|uniref:Acyltransferase 3 domain-containing protein n=1 Tax=Rhizobium esperanzae TaxID=1967781 RepID=A0A7W6R762_9HYPH|nr:acyltransferase [Rhizobium esperanzae]MBB4237670.1 hypothetical protein [Rhizobium esperanzae]